ncbi:MAG: HD family phosphohydrolase [Bacteroidota bacterium]
MSKSPSGKKKRFLILYTIFLFVLVYGIIVYMYPRERKFAYEFQRGAPWTHQDLIADYDFPVYKSQEEVSRETDSIRKNFRPYYKKDTNVKKKTFSEFERVFEKEWKKFWSKTRIKTVIGNIPDMNSAPFHLKNPMMKGYKHLYDSIYEAGVLREDSIFSQSAVRILKNGSSYEVSRDDVFVIKEAKQIVNKGPDIHAASTQEDSLLQEFSQNLEPDRFLRVNLIYDEELNDEILAERLEDISLTRGMVQKGELIIQEGGIVDGETYKILNSLKREHENSANVTRKGLLIFGISLLYAALALALYFFLWNFKPKILRSPRKITFVLLQVFIMMMLVIIITRFTGLSVYIIPFALVPMVINTFYDSRTALFVHLVIILMAGFLAPNGFEFVLLQMFAGIVAVFSLTNIQKRKQLFVTSFYVLLVYALTYFSLQMLYGNGIKLLNWNDFVWFGVSAALLLFTLPMIYAYEKIFGFVSDVTLMELADTNNPLLRQLAEKAPGTFQHSIQVGNLAEAVAREIGGNPLLVRTGALYHDIGKAATPHYFVENQSGKNPHDDLDYDESARLIISHVTTGEKMARKAKLPEQVIDFITTHHGRSRAEYFYRSFVNKYPDKEPDEEKFSYPGPRPKNIENAILMMADAVEAATRSLQDYTEPNIRKMVHQVIDGQKEAGQFENVDITFRNITKAKRIFTEKLLSIYHTRIEYPDLKKNKKDKNKKQ